MLPSFSSSAAVNHRSVNANTADAAYHTAAMPRGDSVVPSYTSGAAAGGGGAAAANTTAAVPAVSAASVKTNRVARQVEDYNRLLNSVGAPSYATMKALFAGETTIPADTMPSIQVSFELFETVQNRFAATKQTLERTKADLLTRNQQYSQLQAEMQTLKEENAVANRRAADAEERNTQLHQYVAKQDVTVEQLRKELSLTRAEVDAVQEKLVQREEELQSALNRVAEGLVLLSQKDAAIATLRRELGKYQRYPGSRKRGGGAKGEGGAGEDGDENDAAENPFSDEALRNIAADVAGRSQEARMKLSVADLEATLQRTVQEKSLILQQHQEYRRHVQSVVTSYEQQSMALEDAAAGHVCVRTPYLLSSTYYQPLLQSKTAPSAGEDADAAVQTFYALASSLRRELERVAKINIDSGSHLKAELSEFVAAQRDAVQVSTELVGFLATFEKEVVKERLTLHEVREQWRLARVPYFASAVADGVHRSVTTLSKGLVQLLERESQHLAAAAKAASAAPTPPPATTTTAASTASTAPAPAKEVTSVSTMTDHVPGQDRGVQVTLLTEKEKEEEAARTAAALAMAANGGKADATPPPRTTTAADLVDRSVSALQWFSATSTPSASSALLPTPHIEAAGSPRTPPAPRGGTEVGTQTENVAAPDTVSAVPSLRHTSPLTGASVGKAEAAGQAGGNGGGSPLGSSLPSVSARANSSSRPPYGEADLPQPQNTPATGKATTSTVPSVRYTHCPHCHLALTDADETAAEPGSLSRNGRTGRGGGEGDEENDDMAADANSLDNSREAVDPFRETLPVGAKRSPQSRDVSVTVSSQRDGAPSSSLAPSNLVQEARGKAQSSPGDVKATKANRSSYSSTSGGGPVHATPSHTMPDGAKPFAGNSSASHLSLSGGGGVGGGSCGVKAGSPSPSSSPAAAALVVLEHQLGSMHALISAIDQATTSSSAVVSAAASTTTTNNPMAASQSVHSASSQQEPPGQSSPLTPPLPQTAGGKPPLHPGSGSASAGSAHGRHGASGAPAAVSPLTPFPPPSVFAVEGEGGGGTGFAGSSASPPPSAGAAKAVESSAAAVGSQEARDGTGVAVSSSSSLLSTQQRPTQRGSAVRASPNATLSADAAGQGEGEGEAGPTGSVSVLHRASLGSGRPSRPGAARSQQGSAHSASVSSASAAARVGNRAGSSSGPSPDHGEVAAAGMCVVSTETLQQWRARAAEDAHRLEELKDVVESYQAQLRDNAAELEQLRALLQMTTGGASTTADSTHHTALRPGKNGEEAVADAPLDATGSQWSSPFGLLPSGRSKGEAVPSVRSPLSPSTAAAAAANQQTASASVATRLPQTGAKRTGTTPYEGGAEITTGTPSTLLRAPGPGPNPFLRLPPQANGQPTPTPQFVPQPTTSSSPPPLPRPPAQGNTTAADGAASHDVTGMRQTYPAHTATTTTAGHKQWLQTSGGGGGPRYGQRAPLATRLSPLPASTTPFGVTSQRVGARPAGGADNFLMMAAASTSTAEGTAGSAPPLSSIPWGAYSVLHPSLFHGGGYAPPTPPLTRAFGQSGARRGGPPPHRLGEAATHPAHASASPSHPLSDEALAALRFYVEGHRPPSYSASRSQHNDHSSSSGGEVGVDGVAVDGNLLQPERDDRVATTLANAAAATAPTVVILSAFRAPPHFPNLTRDLTTSTSPPTARPATGTAARGGGQHMNVATASWPAEQRRQLRQVLSGLYDAVSRLQPSLAPRARGRPSRQLMSSTHGVGQQYASPLRGRGIRSGLTVAGRPYSRFGVGPYSHSSPVFGGGGGDALSIRALPYSVAVPARRRRMQPPPHAATTTEANRTTGTTATHGAESGTARMALTSVAATAPAKGAVVALSPSSVPLRRVEQATGDEGGEARVRYFHDPPYAPRRWSVLPAPRRNRQLRREQHLQRRRSGPLRRSVAFPMTRGTHAQEDRAASDVYRGGDDNGAVELGEPQNEQSTHHSMSEHVTQSDDTAANVNQLASSLTVSPVTFIRNAGRRRSASLAMHCKRDSYASRVKKSVSVRVRPTAPSWEWTSPLLPM